MDYLEEALATQPPHWLVRQAGILIPLAMAYARKRDRERSLSVAEQVIPVIRTVNAPMTNTHFLEYIKIDVLGRFPHDSRMRTFLTEVHHHMPHLPVLVDAL